MPIFKIPGTIDEQAFKQAIPVGLSALGTAVFDNLVFPAGQWTDRNNEQIAWNEFRLDALVMVVNRAKNITRHKIAGKDGTVAVFTSLGDFKINISATISDIANVFPADQIDIWKEIERAQASLPVISKFLNEYFEIYNVTLDTMSINQKLGSLNTVLLSMSLTSDTDFNPDDFEIILK